MNHPELAEEYLKTVKKFVIEQREELIQFWNTHIDKLIDIFDRNYDGSDVPVWINFGLFKQTKLKEMCFELSAQLDGIMDNDRYENLPIDFTKALGIPFASKAVFITVNEELYEPGRSILEVEADEALLTELSSEFIE